MFPAELYLNLSASAYTYSTSPKDSLFVDFFECGVDFNLGWAQKTPAYAVLITFLNLFIRWVPVLVALGFLPSDQRNKG